MWTDPPDGVSYKGGTADQLEIENDDAEGPEGLLQGAVSAADGILADGAAIYGAHPDGACLPGEFGEEAT